jgi:hypothetical protein
VDGRNRFIFVFIWVIGLDLEIRSARELVSDREEDFFRWKQAVVSRNLHCG